MSMMRAKLLTGVAALVLYASTAHAAVELPEEMLGKWCRIALEYAYDVYNRGSCEDGDDILLMRGNGFVEYHYYDDGCVFNKIEKIASGLYLIYAHCGKFEGPNGPEQDIIEELQIVDGQLVMRDIPES